MTVLFVCSPAYPFQRHGHGAAETPMLGTDANENFGLECVKSPENSGKERLKRLETVAVGHKDDDGHRQRLQVLLEFDVLVGCEQRVEFNGGLTKKRAIAKAGPPHLSYGANLVGQRRG